MKQMLVRYKTKPDRTEENQRLIQGVFRELQVKSPEGVRYLALKLNDGSFVHFVATETKDGTSPIPALEAFKAFQQGIKERCIEPPQSGDVTVVGNYRMLAD
ncbi:MAG TPA: hypothetical protein VH765_05110 [Xanthobacteraceae bacterium]|jgi:hypothetical protein